MGGTGLLEGLFGHLEAAMHETGTGRDELADDHVLLQTEQRVGGSADGGARQHLDGVLEGGSRQERVGAQGGLGHAQQQFMELGRDLALG